MSIVLFDVVVKKNCVCLILFMLVLYVLVFFDCLNIGFVKQIYQIDIGLSNEVYVLGVGIFFVVYVFLGVLVNFLMCKLGVRIWIGMIILLWGFFLVVMVWVDIEVKFLIVCILFGVVEVGFFSGMIYFIL